MLLSAVDPAEPQAECDLGPRAHVGDLERSPPCVSILEDAQVPHRKDRADGVRGHSERIAVVELG